MLTQVLVTMNDMFQVWLTRMADPSQDSKAIPNPDAIVV